MSVALLEDTPLVPPRELGPYRRADYEALPDEPRCELIFGRIYVNPSPSLGHQTVLSHLGSRFWRIAEESGGQVYLAPLDVVLADHSVVQPDLIYVSAGNQKILRERIVGPPDLVVEILSPGTARRDRGES